MEIVAKAGKMPGNSLEVSVFFYAKLFSWPTVGKLCRKDNIGQYAGSFRAPELPGAAMLLVVTKAVKVKQRLLSCVLEIDK